MAEIDKSTLKSHHFTTQPKPTLGPHFYVIKMKRESTCRRAKGDEKDDQQAKGSCCIGVLSLPVVKACTTESPPNDFFIDHNCFWIHPRTQRPIIISDTKNLAQLTFPSGFSSGSSSTDDRCQVTYYPLYLLDVIIPSAQGYLYFVWGNAITFTTNDSAL